MRVSQMPVRLGQSSKTSKASALHKLWAATGGSAGPEETECKASASRAVSQVLLLVGLMDGSPVGSQS